MSLHEVNWAKLSTTGVVSKSSGLNPIKSYKNTLKPNKIIQKHHPQFAQFHRTISYPKTHESERLSSFIIWSKPLQSHADPIWVLPTLGGLEGFDMGCTSVDKKRTHQANGGFVMDSRKICTKKPKCHSWSFSPPNEPAFFGGENPWKSPLFWAAGCEPGKRWSASCNGDCQKPNCNPKSNLSLEI